MENILIDVFSVRILQNFMKHVGVDDADHVFVADLREEIHRGGYSALTACYKIVVFAGYAENREVEVLPLVRSRIADGAVKLKDRHEL